MTLSSCSKKSIKTLIVLGSGGHTAEMVRIIKELDKKKFTPRIYVLAKSDKTSRCKVMEAVENRDSQSSISFVDIFRSRTVNQSYLTSVITTLIAMFECIPLCWRVKPDMILCNGPGTCVPICLVAYFLGTIRLIPKCKIIFIESFCRVKTMSLSGKILRRITDMFVVQWPDLLPKNSGNMRYFGRIM